MTEDEKMWVEVFTKWGWATTRAKLDTEGKFTTQQAEYARKWLNAFIVKDSAHAKRMSWMALGVSSAAALISLAALVVSLTR